MNDIQAIIFDYGRVIGHFDHARTAARLAPYSRLPLNSIRAFLYPDALEDSFERGELSAEQFVAALRDHLQLDCQAEVIRRAVADIFWANEPVCALVPRLAGRYRLVLGSNTNAIHADHFRVLSEPVLRHFHKLILSHEVRVRKPSVEFFEHCIAAAGRPARSCLFIDDLPANIAGAKAAGLQTLLYTGQETLPAELAALGVVIAD
jgi:putative hydrolase of the HAD superfamily